MKYIGLSSNFEPEWTGTHVLDARHTFRSHFYTKKDSGKSKTANNLMVILRAVNLPKKTCQKHTSFTDKSPVDLARACTGALQHARTPQPAHKKKRARGSASRGRAPTPGPRNLNENPASEKLLGKKTSSKYAFSMILNYFWAPFGLPFHHLSDTICYRFFYQFPRCVKNHILSISAPF